jgi:mono/diheme cytochrome c family protein
MKSAAFAFGFLATAIFSLVMARSSIAQSLAAAKTNYTTFCAKCHGTEGNGDGFSGASLKTRPRDFTDCARMAKRSDDILFDVIKNGGAANGLSADMTGWSQGFKDSEIHDLVSYVRTFCVKK